MTENDKLDLILNKVAGIETGMKSMADTLGAEIAAVRTDLRTEIAAVKNNLGAEITAVKLTLENVTNKNIQIIAEGHLDLSRKLDEVQNVKFDKEMIKMKLNILEYDVMKLKEKPIQMQI
jgi:hypothetical protein